MELLRAKWAEGKFVCVGLDTTLEKIPQVIALNCNNDEDTILEFNKEIIDATADIVCAYKPNIAFYEGLRCSVGINALQSTVSYILGNYPNIPIIIDAKRADIESTNNGYVRSIFDNMQADAVTINPYLGFEAMQPFLERKEKGIIVLCKTSNKGSGEFQNLEIELGKEGLGGIVHEPNRICLYEWIALAVKNKWNANGNCALVVGATYPHDLKRVRKWVGDMPILIPGIGAQGAEIEATVKAGMDSKNEGMIINSSRGIIYASSGSDFAERAREETIKLHKAINQFRVA